MTSVLTEAEREAIHRALDMLGDYQALQRHKGNIELSHEVSTTRGVLQGLFRFLASRQQATNLCQIADPIEGRVDDIENARKDHPT